MNKENTGTIFILIGLFIYGVHPIVIEVGTGFLAPLVFATLAAMLAGFIATLLAFFTRKSPKAETSRHDYCRLIFAGVFGTFLAYTGLFLGLQFTTSNNAAVILRSEIVFALLLSYMFLGETISFRQALWMVIMMIGVLLVIVTTQLTALGIGDLLILVTPAAWAAAHTIVKPTLARVSPWMAVAFRNLVGGSLLGILAFALIVLGNPIFLVPHLPLILIITVIEVFVILLAHGLWYAGIHRINLGKATALIAPAPLVTFLFSLMVLALPPTPWQIVGALLAIIATILLSREASLQRRTPTKTP